MSWEISKGSFDDRLSTARVRPIKRRIAGTRVEDIRWPTISFIVSRSPANAYRAALMLNLMGADWQPVFVDFFNGETRTAAYRSSINEMGEAPVLVHAGRKLSQSAVILDYLAQHSGQFLPSREDDRREALRWIVFDNQKVGGCLGPYRFLRNFAKPPGESGGHRLPQRAGFRGARRRRQAAVRRAVSSRRHTDRRGYFDDQLSLLSGR